jgi:hypothetical protein
VSEQGAIPSLVVAGKGAASVSTIQFVAEDKSVVTGTVANGKVSVPTELKVGSRYEMQLIGAGKTQLAMPVRIVANNSPLVVLNVD